MLLGIFRSHAAALYGEIKFYYLPKFTIGSEIAVG